MRRDGPSAPGQAPHWWRVPVVEPNGSQQAPKRSHRRLDYTRDSKIAVMIRLLEKGEALPEPRRGRRAVVAGIVIAVVVVALVFATLGFLAS